MVGNLPVINLTESRYECIFGRGCDGICCRNGRPGLYAEEVARIDANLDKILPEMRPEARERLEQDGYVSGRRRLGLPMLRVVNGWCIFFNQGCALNKVGAAEGDKYRYKPAACALFPLARDENDRWYVRQHGLKSERWDLFCLDPAHSSRPAAESLSEEVRLAMRFDREATQTSLDALCE